MNKSMIHDPSGKVSMIRVMTLVVVVPIVGVFIAHNVISMLHGNGFVSMGAQEATLLIAMIGAKVGQSFGEKKPDDSDDDSDSITNTSIVNNTVVTTPAIVAPVDPVTTPIYTPKVPDSAKE